VLIADNWFINIMNLYTGGFAVVNVVPRIGRFWATVIVAAAGIILSGLRIVYENTPAFVNEIGFAFAPVSGILLAHYAILSRFRIDLPSIYKTDSGRYRYWHGINPVAIAVGIAGYLVARSELIDASLIRPLVVVILTGAVYAIAMGIAARFWRPARDAIDAATIKDRYDALEVNRELLAEEQV
jgi:nucleobase:cation symporter-1, NCS1 family